MNIPSIGDTFQATCPWCSPETPVLHVVRYVDRRKNKYYLDMICTGAQCHRSLTGSFEETNPILYATWLEVNSEGRTQHLRTEQIQTLLPSVEWAARLQAGPEMSANDREVFERRVVDLLKRYEFDRKRSLETELAVMEPSHSALNLSYMNHLRLAFPEFSGLLKKLRIGGRVKFGLHYGHHMFGRGKRRVQKGESSAKLAHERLLKHRVESGSIQVTIAFYVPVKNAQDIEHFFQSVFPWAELRTPYHRITLNCTYGDRKKQRATFRIDGTDFALQAQPHRLELTARLAERDIALSLMKAILMGNIIAREVTCTARMEQQLLMFQGYAHFPSTIVVHNQLPHSELLWKSEFNNLHRAFHAFPKMDGANKRSVSQRLLMSHTTHPHPFASEEISAHLEQFQLLFLREFIGAMGSEDMYVPPSVLRAYAPRGPEIEALVAELTGLYEERLKKAALEREKAERLRERFLNQSNFWLSVMFLLFSIASTTDEKWINYIVAGLAGVFVIFLAVRGLKHHQDDKRE